MTEAKRKSEPEIHKDSVRMILVWRGQENLNLHEIAFIRT